jgi:23S rRNA (guanine2445-N2)-methyltransferase / 23S rRNA (guanine2069-N7)-methyltransferase
LILKLLHFFATAPKGLEALLAQELIDFGAKAVKPKRAGVAFEGPLALGYRACLGSRVASRILLNLTTFKASSPEELYAGVRSLRWDEHLAPTGSLAVDFNAARSAITHTHFGALKVKDAIVDQFRETHGPRPSVALTRPDVRINVHLEQNDAYLGLDLSGDSLHRRAYREETVAAPLKENLAAALLLYAGWPALAASGAPLLDPLCGSGTLCIEAAFIAGDIAPGLLRPYYGFMGWRGHDPKCWSELLDEAAARKQAGCTRMPKIAGYDADRNAVRIALGNIEWAGLRGLVHAERREFQTARPLGQRAGLIITNPPYGERLDQDKGLPRLYADLGDTLAHHFAGWRAAVFTGNPELSHRLRLSPEQTYTLYNGTLKCKLLIVELPQPSPELAQQKSIGRMPIQRSASPTPPAKAVPSGAGTHVEMFANRLHKNLKRLGRWAERQGIDCYRLYDRDLPEYALAIDLYQGERDWVHVQEYEAPATVDSTHAEARLQAALGVIPQLLEIPAEQMFLKLRRRQRGTAQYQTLGRAGEFYPIGEGGCKFLVNFTDYLDTGLFLDHRLIRAIIQALAPDRRFLNLFGYTGTATVYAALGGAKDTTTVDLSATYLDWTRRNLTLNGIGGDPHHLVQADCLEWLSQAAASKPRPVYGLILLDPPTFSNSKRMRQTLDIQRDHVDLIVKTAKLLEPRGVLIFSINRQRFKLEADALRGLKAEDITAATIPLDFSRHPGIHQCWRITRE